MPSDLDFQSADPARVWNALAKGKNNLRTDRALADAALTDVPDFGRAVSSARAFHLRACETLARDRITQFIDFRPGLWDDEGTQGVIHRISPEARILFVDDNSCVMSHARALYCVNECTHALRADAFDPAAVLSHPEVRQFLDWTRPIALLHSVTFLQYPEPAPDAAKLMQTYLDTLPAGSYIASVHWRMPDSAAASQAAQQVAERLGDGMPFGSYLSREAILDLLAGQELLPPGLVPCDDWPDVADSSGRPWTLDHVVGAVGHVG